MGTLTNIPTYFFLGIGGIGMSALARYLVTQNAVIFGFDRIKTELTTQLENEGIAIYYNEDAVIRKLSDIGSKRLKVIYTPAISTQSKLFIFVTKGKFQLQKRAALLGEVTNQGKCLAVAGTHGKTTTSAILAHLFISAEVSFTAFLGGILNGINSNFYSSGNEVYVVEADEFDRSFLQLKPTSAVITSMDADHLDIYGSVENFEEGFMEFTSKVSDQLWVNEDIALQGNKIGFQSSSTALVSNISVKDEQYMVDFCIHGVTYKGIKFPLPGRHNLFNALAALCLAISTFPLKASEFLAALSSFPGVKRRFNYLYKSKELVLIDDYAHHPTEILAAYQGAKEMHPNESLMVIFQPHLFSRTENFADEFAKALEHFDEICLLEIYPARELPIEGVNASFLLQKINSRNKKIIEKDTIKNYIDASNCRVCLLLGAGDIGEEAIKLKTYFSNEIKLV